MGYYTSYSLSIVVDANACLLGDSRRKEIIEHLLKMAEDDKGYWSIFRDSLRKELEGVHYDIWTASIECKWYEHDQDMKALSLKFPDIIFMLHGEGEEEGDKWNTYYLNGRKQFCKAEITITYPEFELDLLKAIEDKS